MMNRPGRVSRSRVTGQTGGSNRRADSATIGARSLGTAAEGIEMTGGAQPFMDGADDIGAWMAAGVVTAGGGDEITDMVFGAVHGMTVKTADSHGIVLDDGLNTGIACLDIGRSA